MPWSFLLSCPTLLMSATNTAKPPPTKSHHDLSMPSHYDSRAATSSAVSPSLASVAVFKCLTICNELCLRFYFGLLYFLPSLMLCFFFCCHFAVNAVVVNFKCHYLYRLRISVNRIKPGDRARISQYLKTVIRGSG
jgi:hypothetical protein